MNWYLKVIKNYVEFNGRARRKEYWMFTLFNLIFLIVAAILDNILGTTFKIQTIFGSQDLPYGYFYLLYGIAVMIPGLAVTIRRLHDVGKNGWMIFIVLIPLVGAIWILVLLCEDSQSGENAFGPNPKETTTI